MARKKKGFYRRLEDWSEKIAQRWWGCNGNELVVHMYLNMRFIKHEMQVRVEMPQLARNSHYILVDFVIPYKGREIWVEYNGTQHDHYNGRYQRNQDDFNRQRRRDVVEHDYCQQHDIPLIIISHSRNYFKSMWHFHKRLNQTMKQLKAQGNPQ